MLLEKSPLLPPQLIFYSRRLLIPPVYPRIGVDTKSRMVRIGLGVLKRLRVNLSSLLMNKRGTKGLGVTNERCSRVGPTGGMDSSLIHSVVGSSSPICIMSIRAGCGVVSTSCTWLYSTSKSLITSSTIIFTDTSLGAIASSTACILGGEVCSDPVGTSSSLVGSEGPG